MHTHTLRSWLPAPLADQTLAVFEPPQPNTGLPGGKFLERAKVYKPGSKLVG